MTAKRQRSTLRRTTGTATKKGGKKDSAAHQDTHHAPTNEFELQQTFIEAEDKLNLNEEELEMVHSRLLEAVNPNASKNRAVYSFEEKVFKIEPIQDQVAIHFAFDSVIVRKDSEEAKEMYDEEEKRRLALEEKKLAQLGMADKEASSKELDDVNEDQLRNQFNCSHRATQTYINDFKQDSMNTDDPPTREFSDNATQWQIYDCYVKMMADQKDKKDDDDAADDVADDKNIDDFREKTADEIMYSEEMTKTVKLVERMINQNINEELLEDFKFWEDESDKYKEEGSLLPLWRFSNDKTNKKHVTGICWNPHYHDLFAVSFGSYEFTKQNGGVICCYSLKNPSYPEYMFTTKSGVTAIDFHPQHASLLAAGMYDGTVAIYDIRTGSNEPIIKSNVRTGKHTDAVWQIRWDQETISGSLTFFSVSSDGRVTSWTLAKNELQHTDIMYLKRESLNGEVVQQNDETSSNVSKKSEAKEQQQALHSLSGGTCFDFNKNVKHLFVVGTEDGLMHQCSKAYNSQYLNTYHGHHLAVYAVKWNYHHEQLFLSGSADWSVKLWDYKKNEPLLQFDLGASVGDIAWAPFSASVFAAVTDDGRVHVYDLNKNKHDAVCDQLVVRKAKLTHLAFNPSSPILLVGDDKGLVQAVKLSPNLKIGSQKLDLSP
mmetsp:Transcript_8217/g.30340  ORF Transcript_8217/g.30340 Transcript_8217/m.30340 type:complete len:658 (-) Transcript_8217:198-2171(-)|eukprot:CAMPEP_0117442880 /NCGR_PEP_ID=MMETSP0759-20121206/4391_1 /TAXON_ID=63605 /ORGANISM="Percolomonas cosmopolitus, Strain WS" /LENGTH=657 /DNA_ID=CAMNT_0005234805 /DNA_START=118 /DNA_END=2091 /DNA_ORIENTATION=-